MALYYTPDLGKLIEASFLSIIALTWEKSYYITKNSGTFGRPTCLAQNSLDFSPTSETFCRQMETTIGHPIQKTEVVDLCSYQSLLLHHQK